MSRNPRYNASGCLDMTAYEAIRNMEREEKNRYEKVYICSPFAGDTEKNTQNALRYCRFALERGKFPIAPHCYLPLFMDDNDSAERELALSFGLRLLYGCRELWVFGDTLSEGMKGEIKKAHARSIPVKYFTADCEVRRI